jgi:hypothetical protein
VEGVKKMMNEWMDGKKTASRKSKTRRGGKWTCSRHNGINGNVEKMFDKQLAKCPENRMVQNQRVLCIHIM